MQKSKRKPSKPRELHRPLSLERLEIRRVLAGPYAPPAGQEGSTAIDAQDPAIEGWASRVIEYTLGTELDEQFSDSSLAIGPVTPGSPSVVSLGRGGQITLGFSSPIRDGLGFDFAVFENGFSDTFLELARVQVSSDGANFFEFESRSLTAEPVSAFGSLDTTNIDGLAGKYRVGFGTPFDLADLRGVDPSLNVDRVTHVRIIDVVGDGSSLDSQGDPIYDPYPTVGSAGFDLDGVAALHLLDTGESEVGFEDVGSSLADESFFSGPIAGGEQSTGEFGEIITRGWFESGGLEFNNTFSDFFEFDFTSWNQWAYSNVTDNVTGGFQNQYGVITGSGAEDSRTFGVAYVDQQGGHAPPTIQKSAEDARQFKSLLLTNTTYAVRSMQNGDSFAKKFGGASGTDEDFFKLTVTGLDNNGVAIDALEIFLADFRFPNSEDDYILEDWVEVDLTPLADAASLEFTLDSSDVGESGINTPTYFAVDNIQLTEPTLFVDVTPSIVDEDSPDPVTGRVTRFHSDPSFPLTVDLAVDDSSRVGLPASVTIPANTSFVDFSLELINDDLVNGDQSVLVSASATGQMGDQESLLVLEDDILSLQLEASETTLSEGNSFSVSVSRNAADLSTPLTVAFSATPDGLIDFPSEVVIPVGQASTTFSISAPEDEIDRANEQVQLVAAAADYLDATLLVDWQDNDEATLTLSTSQATYSEADAQFTAGFEIIGRTIADGRFLNGSDQQGGFDTEGIVFNNSYTYYPDYGDYWEGWSISNTTDTETGGPVNQYSSYTGSGASGSETYGVAYAGGITVPEIVISADHPDASFDSVMITNTTYAALDMQSVGFSKKFGGNEGTDPDYFLLKIKGVSSTGEEVGVVEFALADYRFEDSASDYIVDQWTRVDLSSLVGARKLQFAMESSDNNQFGMLTPAYFALDQVMLTASQDHHGILVERNTFDVSTELIVDIVSDDISEIENIGRVVIPAGQSSTQIPLPIMHDHWVDGDQSVLISATSQDFIQGDLTLTISDIDEPELTLSFSNPTVAESDGQAELLVHRNVESPETELSVSLTSDPVNQFQSLGSVVLPIGNSRQLTNLSPIDNGLGDGDRVVVVTGTATGFTSSSSEIVIEDDEKVLQVTTASTTLSESAAPTQISFEDLGSTIPQESYLNGIRGNGSFTSGEIEFNNSYTYYPDYGDYWEGWSISNTTDTETGGPVNQYSSYTGSGASGSETYGVAYAGGITVPEIVISADHPDASFDSVMITNTTYAALDMQSVGFSKKFGGNEGTDPDYFLLKIKGVSSTGEEVGVVEFALADYRFEDSASDYIVDQWTRVDLSSLVGARKLQFAMESSDNNQFGMLTPAYFALDQVILSKPDDVPPVITITRVNDDLSEELTVDLSSSDTTELEVPSQVTLPVGQSSVEIPVSVVDDFVFDGVKSVEVTATTADYVSGSLDISIEDDDTRKLTLSLWSIGPVSESDGQAELLVHRNVESPETELSVSLTSDPVNQFQSLGSVVLPIGNSRQLTNLSPIDNGLGDGDRVVVVTGTATGFTSSSSEIVIEDDEKVLQVTTASTTLSESAAPTQISFEDLGSTIPQESYLNGIRGNGSFTSGEIEFNNSYTYYPDYGDYWEGWSISNTTDTETGGPVNQYSSYTGSGASGSETYGVAYAGGITVPEIVISADHPDASFDSVMITNTTYAALDMQSVGFSKKFGGNEGTDPDYFLLKIKGVSSTGEEVGVVEFALADYRFEDSASDYIVDQWTRVDLSSLVGARKLQFAMESSDNNQFGMLTPAYFALDQVILSKPDDVPPVITITRVNDDLSEELTVDLSSSDTTELEVPSQVTLPVGQSSVEIPVSVVDDFVFDGVKSVEVTATTADYVSGSLDISIEDDDTRKLTLSLWSIGPVSESDGQAELLVHRNVESPETELSVSLTSDPVNQFQSLGSVVLPIGNSRQLTNLSPIDNGLGDGDRVVVVTGTATGFTSSSSEIVIEDDEKVLQVTTASTTLSESAAPTQISFEDLGSTIPQESYLNGIRGNGSFTSGEIEFNNSYTYYPDYGDYWEGWSISNTTDTETGGPVNQYSSYTGSGASGSETYGVAYAGGITVPEIVISADHPDASFDSVMITNTTYAALDMQSVGFSKKFGGNEGTDPDYFLLKIKGVSSTGEEVGVVEFALADYRFEDSASDYIVDQWTRVDLSSLVGARKLQFAMESSDNNQFGMLTPAYFALDQVILSKPDDVPPVITITRVNDDLSEELTVDLSSSDTTELEVPSQVTLPVGQSSVEIPVSVVDDFVFDGVKSVEVTATTADYVSGSLDISIEDDDTRKLTLSLWSVGPEYYEGNDVEFVVHRNDASVQETLAFDLTDTNQQFVVPTEGLELGSGLSAKILSIPIRQNAIVDGDRISELKIDAPGLPIHSVQVPIADDEVPTILVEATDGTTVIGEVNGTDEILVSLAYEPLGNVKLILDLSAANDEILSDLLEFTFTPEDWNVKQSAELFSSPDLLIEGDEQFTISMGVDIENTTALYADADPAPIDVKVLDQNPNELRVETNATSIQLIDNISEKVIQQAVLASGLQIIANDLAQSLEIANLQEGVGPLQVGLRAGDDIVVLRDQGFDLLDGGADQDALHLRFENPLDFVDALAGRVTSFEKYHLTGAPVHIKSTDLSQLAINGNQLRLVLDPAQELTFSTDAVLKSPAIVDGVFVHLVQLGSVEVESEPGRQWQNPVNHFNVNVQSSGVSALDALIVINELGRRESSELPLITDLTDFQGNYYDVSGDGLLTALDALQVINQLARIANRGEGEYLSPALSSRKVSTEFETKSDEGIQLLDTENVPRLRQFGELRILPALEGELEASIISLAIDQTASESKSQFDLELEAIDGAINNLFSSEN